MSGATEPWLADADHNTREWAAAEAARLDAAMAYGPDNFELFEEQMLKELEQELTATADSLPASHAEFNRALSVRQYAQEFLKDDDEESEYDVSQAGTVPTSPRKSEDFENQGSLTARSAAPDARVQFLEAVPENEPVKKSGAITPRGILKGPPPAPSAGAKAAPLSNDLDKQQKRLRRSIERQVKREMLEKQKLNLAEEQAKLQAKEAALAKRQEDIKKQKESLLQHKKELETRLRQARIAEASLQREIGKLSAVKEVSSVRLQQIQQEKEQLRSKSTAPEVLLQRIDALIGKLDSQAAAAQAESNNVNANSNSGSDNKEITGVTPGETRPAGGYCTTGGCSLM